MSQTDLAERSGIPKPTLSRYENEHVLPSIRTLQRLARSLGLVVAELITAPDRGEHLIAKALRERGIEIRSVAEAEHIADIAEDLLARGNEARRRA